MNKTREQKLTDNLEIMKIIVWLLMCNESVNKNILSESLTHLNRLCLDCADLLNHV